MDSKSFVSHPRLNRCQINSGAKMYGGECRLELMQKPDLAIWSFGAGGSGLLVFADDFDSERLA